MKGWHAANGTLHKSLTTQQNSFILHYTFLLPVLNCELSAFFFLHILPFCFLSSSLSLSSRILLNLHHTDADVFMPWGSCCGTGSRKTADTRITTGNPSFLLQQDQMAAFKHLNPISPHPLQGHEIFMPSFSETTENLGHSVCICVKSQRR